MRALCLTILVCVRLAVAEPADLLATQYLLDHWGPRQGLPEETLTSISQDTEGYLWLGTHRGLVRFDGARFDVPKAEGGERFKDGKLWQSAFDRESNAHWLNVNPGKLVRLKYGRYESQPGWPKLGVDGLGQVAGRVVVFGPDGILIPAGPDLVQAGWEPESLRGKTNVAAQDQAGTIWMGLRDGRLIRVAMPDGTWTLAGEGVGPILKITADPAAGGTIWAVTASELMEVRGGKVTRHRVDRALSLAVTRDGMLWVGAEEGIYRKRAGYPLMKFSNDSLPRDAVHALYEDREENLWVAFRSQGLWRISKPRFVNWGVPEGLSSPDLQAVFESKHSGVWMGFGSGSVNRVVGGRPGEGASVANSLRLNSAVLGFAEDAAGAIWVLEADKLHRIGIAAGLTVRTIAAPARARTLRSVLYSRLDRRIKVLSDGGVWHVAGAGTRLEQEPVAGLGFIGRNGILQESPGGGSWICARSGIYRIRNGQASRMPFEWKDADRYFPFSCYADQAGDLWVGMNGGGIARFRGERFVRVQSRPGDYAFFTFGIGEDLRGGIWFALRNGLIRANKNDLNAYLDRGNFSKEPPFAADFWDTRDGMRSANFGRTTTTLGAPQPAERLWFVSLAGALEIDAERLAERTPAEAHVFVSAVRLGSRPVAVHDGEVQILSSDHALRITIGTTILSARDRVRFRYRLAGHSDGWSMASDSGVVEFPRLNAGDYELVMSVRNGSGGWSENRSLRILVEPRPFETIWFQGLVVAGLALGIWVVVRARMRLLENEKLRLESKVEDRTRDLKAALLAAEAATRSKSDFLANMSHEIRTPMNAVFGMTSLLADMHLTAEARDFVGTIRTSSESLLTILNDILDLSKIESGKLELENRPFDLVKCVEDASELVSQAAASKQLELVCDIRSDVPVWVNGDVTRLRQILVNLLSNAVKFTAAGEVVLTVRLGASGRELEFSVRDTGVGIPEDRLDRLFQSFSQVDASTTRRFGGTGLGLAIASRLTILMGGRIWADSVAGKGSDFQVVIPVVVAAPQDRGSVPPMELRGHRVLIVDDNGASRAALRGRLESWGAEVVGVGSGGEAVALLAVQKFDLALVDVGLPEVDGSTVVGRIQEGWKLPVMLLSNGVMNRRETDRHGADTPSRVYVAKPVKAYSLGSAVCHLLSGGSEAATRPANSHEFDYTLAERVPLRILLAEDNEVNRKVATHLLRRMGYKIAVAGNGAEALEAVRTSTYDVVLMDVHMPVMDGLQATREIVGTWPEAERPSVIGLSANAMDPGRQMAVEAGMDDYVTKPLSVAALQEALIRAGKRVSEKAAARELSLRSR